MSGNAHYHLGALASVPRRSRRDVRDPRVLQESSPARMESGESLRVGAGHFAVCEFAASLMCTAIKLSRLHSWRFWAYTEWAYQEVGLMVWRLKNGFGSCLEALAARMCDSRLEAASSGCGNRCALQEGTVSGCPGKWITVYMPLWQAA